LKDGACDGEGTCERSPDACLAVYRPVCGCDGNTYGNGCTAHSVGVSVFSEGECPSGGCTSNKDCLEDEFCSRDGNCDGEGTCEKYPEACLEIYSPVCGCDGNTYSNYCYAHMVGVSAISDGECPSVAQDGCTSNKDCLKGQFCLKEGSDCDGKGTCQTHPDVCPAVYMPVCGCDGNTYSNGCYASMSGVSVSSRGECTTRPCTSNKHCSEGQFCLKEGDCDGEGTCEDLPEACLDIYQPVCGCDGNTHGNGCYAHMNGVSVASEGECSNDDNNNGCISNEECSEGQFCLKEGDCDGEGTCEDLPEACLDIYQPVCGCDGNTHGNGCYAHMSGVSVASEGECASECESNEECGEGYFCNQDGSCTGKGVCSLIPNLCTMIYIETCGCDENIYSSPCSAHSAGVSVRNTGGCFEG